MKYRLFLVMLFATSIAVTKTMAAQPQAKEQAKPAVDTSKKPAKRATVTLPPLAPSTKKDTTVKTPKKH